MPPSTSNVKPISETAPGQDGWKHLFAAVTGLFIALGLLKFGNPVILASKVTPPETFLEWLYQTWPIEWAYFGFIPMILIGFKVGRWKKPHPVLLLPAIWLGWQFVSATQTVSPGLTALTLKHFTGCVLCFYLGWFALAEAGSSGKSVSRPFECGYPGGNCLILMWIGILLGFAWVIRAGFEQHFGGLEASRRHFELYILPTLKEPPEDLIKKLATNRIFSTLFYPNTLAGVILLFLPLSLVALWQILRKLPLPARAAITGLFGFAGLACLFWSGSKSGWLLMLLLIVLVFLFTPISRKVKYTVISVFLILGITGFALKYAGFFAKGATSVVARTDYWRAAGQIFAKHPVFGTGPGTFSVPYANIKSPEAEMARLCHNDYLEQASDSGIIGFLTYLGFIVGSFWILYRYQNFQNDPFWLCLLLGSTVLNLQGLTEFNLYIPGLAWPNFLFLGFLLGRVPVNQRRTDKPVDNFSTSG